MGQLYHVHVYALALYLAVFHTLALLITVKKEKQTIMYPMYL